MEKIIEYLNENDLEYAKKEAIKRGYKTGTLIHYGFKNIPPQPLGNGKFEINNDYGYPILIKWDGEYFDVIFDHEEGDWTKIANSSKSKL